MSSEPKDEMFLQQAKTTSEQANTAWQAMWGYVRSIIACLPDVQRKTNDLNRALRNTLKELTKAETDVGRSITTALSKKIEELITLNGYYEISIEKVASLLEGYTNFNSIEKVNLAARESKELYEKLEEEFNATVGLAAEHQQKCKIEMGNCQSARSISHGQCLLIFSEFIPPSLGAATATAAAATAASMLATPASVSLALTMAVNPVTCVSALACGAAAAAGTMAMTVYGSFSDLKAKEKEFEELHEELEKKIMDAKKMLEGARKSHREMAKSMANLHLANESQGEPRPRSATTPGSSKTSHSEVADLLGTSVKAEEAQDAA